MRHAVGFALFIAFGERLSGGCVAGGSAAVEGLFVAKPVPSGCLPVGDPGLEGVVLELGCSQVDVDGWGVFDCPITHRVVQIELFRAAFGGAFLARSLQL